MTGYLYLVFYASFSVPLSLCFKKEKTGFRLGGRNDNGVGVGVLVVVVFPLCLCGSVFYDIKRLDSRSITPPADKLSVEGPGRQE